MNVLIIGGTVFLGPHLIEALRARGHRTTLFNRGTRAVAASGAGVELVLGDRENDLARLSRRRFDAIIDTCGYVPRIVRIGLAALAGNAAHYTFVSTISVYKDPLSPSTDERAELMTIDDPSVEQVTGETYGALKALCERAVIETMGERALVVRPGLIVGPLDPTDRFTYWPHRFAQGGDVLVPGPPEHRTSFIDVRDLADFIVAAAERRLAGTFNASGDPSTLTIGRMVEACREAAGGNARPVWAGAAFLEAHGVNAWSDMPAWAPATSSLLDASSVRAVEAGLGYRPLADTVRATMAWTRARGLERPLAAGLTREREAELVAALKLGRRAG